MTEEPKKRRFLTTEQAAEELNVSSNQIRALLKTGELRAIQVGGRGMWRIGVNDLEDYIAGAYRRTEEHIASGEIVDDTEPDAPVSFPNTRSRGAMQPSLILIHS